MLDEVLITSDATKLPPDVAALLDPDVPLPTGIEYFEKRYDLADMLKTLWIAFVAALLGLFGVLFGLADLFDRSLSSRIGYKPSLYGLTFGIVCAFAAWMLVASIWTRLKLRGQQQAGRCTRRGIFLTPDYLVQAYEFDTTIIPRVAYVDLNGDELKYRVKDTDKQFRLPSALVGETTDRLRGAVLNWSRRRVP